MTLANSISEHLISFDTPVEPAKLYTFPQAQTDHSELEIANRQIADLQQQLKTAEETANATAQKQIDALVKAKDEELQAGMDELRKTYEAKVEELADRLQAQIFQHNNELAERLINWCRPVLRNLSTTRCMEDLAAVLETLLNENCELAINGPEDLISLMQPHLSNLPAHAWTVNSSEGSEIVITAGEARIETCLEEWLNTVEGEFSGR
ncbi:MAG: hypothetical protein GY947_20705 [Rhodobacteraceae bacterium]|nr:hypothetical protein [Paracoccaceae bacterium]